MPNDLTTKWKRIGRSGATVDGRTIEPLALKQAAEHYSKQLFTALIWPDHLRWFNMGKVDKLRTRANEEGGLDLFAIICPNEFYLESVKNGQRLFTSMELRPNFRDTGEYYLTGLAATDEPASAATSEMRFSSLKEKDSLIATFTENIEHSFDEDQPPGWFTRFFKSAPDEDEMSKQALAALAEKFTEMEAKVSALVKPDEQDNDGDTTPDEFKTLSAKVDKLADKLLLLTKQTTTETETNESELFKKLSDDMKAFRTEFDQAVNETKGTTTTEDSGDGFDPSAYL